MVTSVRPLEENDIDDAAAICYEAFGSLHNKSHGRNLDFTDLDAVIKVFRFIYSNPKIKGVVAINKDKKVVGSNWIDLRDEVAAIGPVSVSSSVQALGTGRVLMNAVMALDIAKQHKYESVRLAQESYNYASLSLYIKLGFQVNDQTTVFEGHISKPYIGTIKVRRLTEKDVEACDTLHRRAVGVSRRVSILEEAVGSHSRALVAQSENGEILGFGTGISLTFYCVTNDEESLYALHSAFSENFPDEVPILKVTARLYPNLARRCVTEWGLKIQRNLTLMSFGNLHLFPKEFMYQVIHTSKLMPQNPSPLPLQTKSDLNFYLCF